MRRAVFNTRVYTYRFLDIEASRPLSIPSAARAGKIKRDGDAWSTSGRLHASSRRSFFRPPGRRELCFQRLCLIFPLDFDFDFGDSCFGIVGRLLKTG
jgi:hypothetical protein